MLNHFNENLTLLINNITIYTTSLQSGLHGLGTIVVTLTGIAGANQNLHVYTYFGSYKAGDKDTIYFQHTQIASAFS